MQELITQHPLMAAVIAFASAHFGHLTWAQIAPAYQWAKSEGGLIRVALNILWVFEPKQKQQPQFNCPPISYPVFYPGKSGSVADDTHIPEPPNPSTENQTKP